jgi:hypothetical protein
MKPMHMNVAGSPTAQSNAERTWPGSTTIENDRRTVPLAGGGGEPSPEPPQAAANDRMKKAAQTLERMGNSRKEKRTRRGRPDALEVGNASPAML